MKFKIRYRIAGILSIVVMWSMAAAKTEKPVEDNVTAIQNKITWLESSHAYGSACVRITHGKVIYFDPSCLSGDQPKVKADIIFVTHSHDDHFSIKTLQDLSKESTTIIAPKDCHAELSKALPGLKIMFLSPGDKATVDETSIEAIPAYNLESSAHPRTKNWVGYIVKIEGVRIYHSGDTSFIPEMRELNNIDIAILTVRDHYMMNGKQVVEAIASFKPKVVIPVHWLETEKSEIQYIKENAPPGIKFVVLESSLY
jgi:L-ascorbate metabolism protein UlaG (beta-lactamase superfamily)